jgi:hypothetical protein
VARLQEPEHRVLRPQPAHHRRARLVSKPIFWR